MNLGLVMVMVVMVVGLVSLLVLRLVAPMITPCRVVADSIDGQFVAEFLVFVAAAVQ
jgi:hypothetical protein